MPKLLLLTAGGTAAFLWAAAMPLPAAKAAISIAPASIQGAVDETTLVEKAGMACTHRRVCRPGAGCAWRKVCKRW